MTWTLSDATIPFSYALPIGPAVQESLDRQRPPLLADAPVAGAVVLLTQAVLPPLTFTGTLIDQAEYSQFSSFAAKGYPVQITDDRGVTLHVLITEWTPLRVRSAERPWFHTWTLKVLVLDTDA